MIQGFRLQFSSDELKTHIKSRIDYHNTQIEVLSSLATAKREELDTPENREKLRAAFEIISRRKGNNLDAHEIEQTVNSIVNPTVEPEYDDTKEQVALHRNLVDLFTFYSSRLVQNENYVLDLQEVLDLEIFAYAENEGPSYIKKGSISAGRSIRGMQKMMGVASRPKTLTEGTAKSWGKMA